jgi:hypothetical protein
LKKTEKDFGLFAEVHILAVENTAGKAGARKNEEERYLS